MDIQQPSGWSACLLEEIALVLDYRRIPVNNSDRQKRNQGKEQEKLFPYFGATGQTGWIDDFIFDEEIILLGEDGVPFLDPYKVKAYMVQEKCWVNNHAHVLKPLAEACDSRYLLHYLNQFDYRGLVTGSTRLKLNQKAMRGMEINLAPANEQRRIADKLDTTLAAVEACKQKLNNAAETIQRFRQSVLAAAVSGELTREWREERGIDLENWNFEPLGSLVDIKTGPFGSSLHKSDYISGGTPIINPKHISNGKILHEKNTTIGDSDAERLKEFSLLPGDVILGRRGEMGRAACVGLQEAGWICGTGSLILRQKGSLQPEFLQLYLSSPSTIRTLESRSVGSTMVNLNQGILKNIVMPVPSKEEQSAIQLKVIEMQQKADEIHTLINNSNQNSEMLCRALIAKAFRGELVPQDPSDEPASVLLERIKTQREAEAAAKKPTKRERKKKADPSQLDIPAGIADNHLAKALEECGALSERALLAASELEPALFRLQLSKELNAGGLKQVDVDGEAFYAEAAWEE